MKRFKVIWLIGLSLVFLNIAWAQTSAHYKVQPTDILSINVHGHPDLTTKTRVGADGNITFPLLGKVATAGLSVGELEEKLKRELEKSYLVNAQVMVFIEEYHPRQISVVGEVDKPGKYDMLGEKDMTLLQLIATAGGFTKDADIRSVKIMREENGKQEVIKVNVKDITVKGEKDKDIVLKPDDIVVVPESFF